MATQQDIETFHHAFLATALWSSCSSHEDYENIDELAGIIDVDQPSVAMTATLCSEFFDKVPSHMLSDDMEQLGHDFWLTIAGHGSGFWDGDYPKHGDDITEILSDWIAYADCDDEGEPEDVSVTINISTVGIS